MQDTPKKANKILVVDDDPKICAIMAQQLRKEGYETEIVSTGFDVGWATHSFHPDLIFLDIMLPGINGIEVCKQIRDDPRTKGIKIVGMSATEDQSMVQRMREAGIDDFMPKPFSLHGLKERVVRQIGESHPDPASLTNNKVLIFARDAGWAERLAVDLKKGGYAVERSPTLEEMGFRIKKFAPDALVVETSGNDAWLAPLVKRVKQDRQLRNCAVISAFETAQDMQAAEIQFSLPKSADGGKWRETISSAIGPVKKTLPETVSPHPVSFKTPLFTAFLILFGLTVIGIVLWMAPKYREGGNRSNVETPSRPRIDAPIPQEDEVAAWESHERSATMNKLLYYEGGWQQRAQLGKGVSVALKDGRKLDGFIMEIEGRFLLRTMEGNLWIAREDVVSQEPKRQPYEEYWDREKVLSASDAGGHFALGEWCLQQGLQEASRRECRRALIADRNHAAARKALGYSRKGETWVKQ